MSLRESVTDGVARLAKLEAAGSLDATEETLACVEVLESASKGVQKLFGRMTNIEDVADGDIECLLASYYLAKAVQRLRVSGVEEQLRLVKRSRAATLDFLQLASRLSVGGDDRYDVEEEEEQTAKSVRAAAIARHERRRETRKKLAEAEDEREISILRLEEALHNAVHDLRMQDRELQMLEAVAMGAIDEPPTRHGEASWLTEAPDDNGIRVLRVQPGTNEQLEVHRHRVRAGVFRPDPRRLPTVSLEEAAKRELADALQRQQAERLAARTLKSAERDTRRTNQLEQDGDEDDETRYDFATKRDEAWDTWREHHPPGSGNKGDHIY